MKNVLLVFGGNSYEHDISVITASQIFNKTRIDGVNLVNLYISKENRFFIYHSKSFILKDFKDENFKAYSKKFKEVAFVSGEKCKLFLKSSFKLKEYIYAEDIIFACHGGIGENGELVAFFKSLGFGTSAGDCLSLGVCMDKFLFKQVMKGLKIPIVSGFKITKFQFENCFEDFKFKIRSLGFPMILKSNNGGSSIGLFVVKTKDELTDKLKMAFEFDDEVLVEKYCANSREFNIAVVGNNDSFVVSEIDEPLKENEILSFADKYISNSKSSKVKGVKNSMVSQKRKLPADIDLNLRERIRELASRIFECLKLSGIVRIDFLYQEASDKVYVCEVNAIPGSLSYYFFDENMITVNNLIEKLLMISEKNRCKNTVLNKDYFTNVLG